MASPGTRQRKRVVLVGAGHAHLYALKRAAEFARRGDELVVVAPDMFWYSGLATGMLGGLYSPELDQVDVAALARAGGGRFVRDRLAGLDPASRTVRLERGPALAYDVLSLTLGSVPPAIPGAERASGCYEVKPIRRLWELRAELERRFRSGAHDPVRVVVAGGGVTACELAANVLALAARCSGRVELRLLAGGRMLKGLPKRAARKVLDGLRRKGARLQTGGRVGRVEDGHAVLADGSAVPFDLFVNATGLGPPPLVRELGLPADDKGGLAVDEHLRSTGDAAVFGAGDCAAFEGRELPRIGVYAIRQAPVLFHNLLTALDGGEPRRFRPQRRYLWIMNLGGGTGLAARSGLWWHGRAAFRLKDWIDRRFLRECQESVMRG
jgi:NADH dehydrogenase FAD-containing subunit